MTKTRLRNLMVPLGLAVLAAVLVGAYIVSYRNSVNSGAGLVKVLVASRDIPAGTTGSAVASGGYMKGQTVPRRAVVPGSVVSGAPLTSLVATAPIQKGQQITLRQFGPITQAGIFAKFSGRQRAVAVSGDPTQLLAGTVSEGDRVDVVADVHYTSGGISRASSRVVLQNLLVLTAPDGGDQRKQRREDIGDARHDRPPGPDDELGVAEQPVVPRAAPDCASALERPEPRDAEVRPRPRSLGEPDRRRLPGEPQWVATGTRRSFASS